MDKPKLYKRLEVIRGLIDLQETEQINAQLVKLREYDQMSEIAYLISLLEKKNYHNALLAIADLLNFQYGIQNYQDNELVELKTELSVLENQLSEYVTQKTTVEKLIQDFNLKYYAQIGDLLREVLTLRREKLHGEAKFDAKKGLEYEQADKDFKDFNQQFEDSKSRQVLQLSEEEREVMKKSFRKACRLCHPDVVADELKSQAAKIFNELKNAYDMNDIAKVNEILQNLECGKGLTTKSQSITNKDKLRFLIQSYRPEIEKIKEEISEIIESEIYQLITNLKDWDAYISHIKSELEKEAQFLRSSLRSSKGLDNVE
jgi:hypothetical protein